jgi:hypothetical protein
MVSDALSCAQATDRRHAVANKVKVERKKPSGLQWHSQKGSGVTEEAWRWRASRNRP